jgi:hypothetical protein
MSTSSRSTRVKMLARAGLEVDVTAPHSAAVKAQWKMNIDLERPLVPSMGRHDPLDGRIAIETLRATAPDGGDELLARPAPEVRRALPRAWPRHRAARRRASRGAAAPGISSSND